MKTVFMPIIGRLGNILFQVAYGLKWCEQNDARLCMDPWIGEQIFTLPPILRRWDHRPDIVWGEALHQHQRDLIYTSSDVKRWFSWKPNVADRLRKVDVSSHPIVLNLRQGQDYRNAGLVTLSEECYRRACMDRGYDINRVRWEKDTNPTRHDDFPGDLNNFGSNMDWSCLPSFYRLQQAQVLFRANSTFSWWAAALSNGKVYSPVITGLRGGTPDIDCNNFVEGNHPQMVQSPDHSDLILQP